MAKSDHPCSCPYNWDYDLVDGVQRECEEGSNELRVANGVHPLRELHGWIHL